VEETLEWNCRKIAAARWLALRAAIDKKAFD
jgi:hypothetical protein